MSAYQVLLDALEAQGIPRESIGGGAGNAFVLQLPNSEIRVVARPDGGVDFHFTASGIGMGYSFDLATSKRLGAFILATALGGNR